MWGSQHYKEVAIVETVDVGGFDEAEARELPVGPALASAFRHLRRPDYLMHQYHNISFPCLVRWGMAEERADPRDKVYGLPAVAPPRLRSQIRVQYSAPADQVWRDAMRAHVQHGLRLEFMSLRHPGLWRAVFEGPLGFPVCRCCSRYPCRCLASLPPAYPKTEVSFPTPEDTGNWRSLHQQKPKGMIGMMDGCN